MNAAHVNVKAAVNLGGATVSTGYTVDVVVHVGEIRPLTVQKQ